MENQIADALHKAGLAEGQRSVYQDLAKSAEAERVKISEQRGRHEVKSRDLESQLSTVNMDRNENTEERIKPSKWQGSLEERERKLKERQQSLAEAEAEVREDGKSLESLRGGCACFNSR